MECGCECAHDVRDNPPRVYKASSPTAREDYRCCECGAAILAGEKYDRVWGVGDDGAFVTKTCLVCARITRDYCCHHGTLRETIWNALGVDYITGEAVDD